jgi:hypothetical protein
LEDRFIMGFNSALKIPTILPCSNATANGLTVNVGAVITTETSLSGSGLDALGDAADLAAPAEEDWTEILSITGKKQVALRGHTTGTYPIVLNIDPSEDTGDGFRVQVKVDGVIAWDSTLVDHASGAAQKLCGVETITVSYSECEQSFLVRAVRKGTFTNASSVLQVGQALVATLS